MPNKPIKPHITEKAVGRLSDDKKVSSQYTLRVPRTMSKTDIKKVLERDHKVTVEAIRTHINPGKVRRFRGIVGHTKAQKYAVVRIAAGQKLEIFDSMLATGETTSEQPAK
jgi:large subunit ribosomal protein L23